MSVQYESYLSKHKENVHKGYQWILEHIPEVIKSEDSYGWQLRYNHDVSKHSMEEYNAYDRYFYGGNRSYEVVQNFNKAWLHHIHNNPHHWQHWVIINDEPDEGMTILDMPHIYIVEMICDWWSFSWTKGNLYEIFDWYEQRKDYMKLSDKTRKTVEDILEKIKTKLDEEKQTEVADV